MPTGDLPRLARISGSFDADEASARVVLATRKGEIYLPRVFPQPRIAFDFLNGLVEWERQGDAGFSLRVASLTFSNEHLSGNAYGSYVGGASGPGTIDLSAQLNRADVTQLERYLPHARLMGGEATREWLTRGVRAGYSSDVRVRIRGDLREFPFTDPQRGQFRVSARMERGVLDYAEGWPRIENIQGELVFERERMHVAARSASIQGVALSNIEASIPSLRDPKRQLEISGEAQGATADFLKFIQASPVRRMTAGFTDAMSASGDGRLRLKLELPLRGLPKTRVAGEYEFAGNDVKVELGEDGHSNRHGASILPETLRWLWRDYPQPITVKEPQRGAGRGIFSQLLPRRELVPPPPPATPGTTWAGSSERRMSWMVPA